MSGEGVVSEEDASQLSSELDTEPVLPFSSQRELQDSCDTNMSEERLGIFNSLLPFTVFGKTFLL